MEKKTFYEKITTKYKLTVRSEENFAEKIRIKISPAQLISILFAVIIFLYFLSTGFNQLISFLFFEEEEEEKKRRLISLSIRLDSLHEELSKRDLYIKNLHALAEGKITKFELDSGIQKNGIQDTVFSDADIRFLQQLKTKNINFQYKPEEAYDKYLFSSPLSGEITLPVINKKAEISNATGATPILPFNACVIAVSTLDSNDYTLHVQNEDGLILIMEGIRKPIVKRGDCITKNAKLSSVAHQRLLLSLWYKGKALSPEKLMYFKSK